MKLMTKTKANLLEIKGLDIGTRAGIRTLDPLIKSQYRYYEKSNTYMAIFRFCAEIVQKWGFFTPPPSGSYSVFPNSSIRQLLFLR